MAAKLTENRVLIIRKYISKSWENTRVKMIARQFGISVTQLRRIKNGEQWKNAGNPRIEDYGVRVS